MEHASRHDLADENNLMLSISEKA